MTTATALIDWDLAMDSIHGDADRAIERMTLLRDAARARDTEDVMHHASRLQTVLAELERGVDAVEEFTKREERTKG